MDDDDHERREAFAKALENAEVKTREMLLSSHDDLGLALKCHLIAEDSLTNYLIVVKGLRNIRKARLTFIQKVELLDDTDGLVFKNRAGLKELNKIRNGFGHDFEAKLEINSDGEIARCTELFLKGVLKMQEEIIAKFEQSGGELEQIETLRELFSGMITENPDDPNFTGDNWGMLFQKEPREILANFVSSFCETTAIEIYRHKNLPRAKD